MNTNKRLAFELKLGLGSRRTFFQQSIFSKADVAIHYVLVKSQKIKFGPSLQFSKMNLTKKFFSPIQRYYSVDAGYYFSFGSQLKITQSSYIGYRFTEYVPPQKKYWYVGYALQIGMCYEI